MAILTPETVKQLLLSNTFELQPTQKKLCLPILQRIHHKMKLGVTFNSIHVTNGLLIEGHHRYICSVLLQRGMDRTEWQQPSSISVYKWQEIGVDEKDWETVEMIERHNAKDAVKSGIAIGTLQV